MKSFDEKWPKLQMWLPLGLLLAFLGMGLRDAKGVSFLVGSTNGAPANTVLVPVQVSAFSNIETFQFSFHFDPSNATFVDVEQFGLPGLGIGNFGTSQSDLNVGAIRVSWDDPFQTGQSVPDGTTIFAVRLQVIGAVGATSSLLIDGTPLLVEVSNPAGDLLTPTFVPGQLTVSPPNLAPVLVHIGDKTVNEGSLLTFTNSATDADIPAQTLTFSLDTGAPPGASIDATNGTFTWTPTEDQGPGVYPVTIRVTDSGLPPASASETILITVNEVNTAPTLSLIGNKRFPEESELIFTAKATDADLPQQTLTFTLDPGAPDGATIDPSLGVFEWVPTEAQGPGTYTLTIRVTDNGSPPLSDTKTFTIMVDEVNTPPVLAPINNFTIDEGTLLTFTNSATDADLPAQTLTYTVDPGFPVGASITTNGVFSWTPSEAQGPGIYAITIRVSDDFSPPGSDTQTFTVTVNEVNTPPVLAHIGNKTVDEGTLLTFTNSAIDADLPAQTLTYSLDPGFPAGASITSDGVFTWIPTEAQGPGSYAATIRVSDNFSAPASAAETITITVNEVNTPPVLAHIGNRTVDEGTLLTFTNSATDADLPAQTLTYTLDAGFPTGASISSDGIFIWTPTESQGPGSYPVTIRVSDNFSPPASAAETITVTVNEVNTPPVLAHIGNRTVDEGTLLTFTDSATDADLPVQTLTYSLDPGFPTGASITSDGVFTWTPTESQGPGNYPVTIRVSDDFSPPGSAAETITITVNEVNTPPVLAHIGNKTVKEGTLLTFTNSATDADLPAQTLTFSLDAGFPAGASVTTDGVFTWIPTESQEPGNYPVTIRVSDDFSPPASAAETITITVIEVNTPPVLAHIGNRTVDEGALLTFTNSATDVDVPAQTLTYSLDAGFPTGASITSDGVFTWTPTESQGSGSYPVTIRVSDNFSPPASAAETITITVNEVNTPPVLAHIGNKTVNEGTLLTFTNSATDADVPIQTLTYTLDAGFPTGASITSDGVFTWTPTESQGPGSYPVTIRVSDDFSPPASLAETITITVNGVNTPPVLAHIGNRTVDEGTLLTFTNSATDADVPAQTLTYTLDAGFPAGASITSDGVFTWTPTESQGPGSYPVTIRVSDDFSPPGSAAETFTIVVNEVNTSPVLAHIGNKTIGEGSLLTFTNLATDADLPAQTLTYTLDGGAPSGASVTATTGIFTWTPTEIQGPGSYLVTIRVSDDFSPPASAAETITITVNEVNTPPVLTHIGSQTVDEGTLLTFTNSAADADLPAQNLSFTLDPGFPAGASITTNGTFTWTPTEAQGPGSYPVTVRVSDDSSPPGSATETITIIVNEVNTAPVLAHIGSQTVDEGTLLTFTNSATDADLPAQTLTYTLDPGFPTGASITADGVFTWTPTELQGPGSYPVTIRVSDDFSPPGSAAETFTITVNEVNTPPVLTQVSNKTVDEGTLLTFTNSATDIDLPAQTLSYSLDAGAPAGADIDLVTGVFTWRPTEAQGPGVYLVNIRVTDSFSPPASAFQTITISVNEVNTPPVLATRGDQTVDEGSLLSFSVSATDADIPAQVLTYTLDTGAPTGTAIDPATGVFTWTPTEAQGPGVYPVTIRVTDNGSPPASAAQTISITVNEVNSAPILAPISDQTVFEGVLFTFASSATDSDLPAQTLTYSLVGGPVDASITPDTGVFTWIPPELPNPSTNSMSVVVMDNGSPSLAATQSFTITVLKTNSPPVFMPQSNYVAEVLLPLMVTNLVTDPDIPTNRLTFELVDGPKGVRINKFTGVVTWVPDKSDARSTNLISLQVIDDGVPRLSTTNSFQVYVDDYLELTLGRYVLRAGDSGSVDLTVTNTTGVTNLSSLLFVSPLQLANLTLSNFASQVNAGVLEAQDAGITKLTFSTIPGQILQPGQFLAQLHFTAVATHSAFVPLLISNVTSVQTNGVPLTRTLANAGRVVVVAEEPLLEAFPSTNQQASLLLYGLPGTNYLVQWTTSPFDQPAIWQQAWQGTMTSLVQTIQLPIDTNMTIYYRSIRP